jgi:hypothetical protein
MKLYRESSSVKAMDVPRTARTRIWTMRLRIMILINVAQAYSSKFA